MNIEMVKRQLSRLKHLLSESSTDVCWSSYDNANEVITELDLLEKGITNEDCFAIKRLLYLLAPTGTLQEISISSGWGYEFLDIAASLEKTLDKPIL